MLAKKFNIFVYLIMIMMTIGCLVVGIYCALDTSFTAKGDISYSGTQISDETPLLKYDSGSNYYYLELGNINGSTDSPIRWRLISENGVSPYEASSDNKPTSYSGIYLLETWDAQYGENGSHYKKMCFDCDGSSDGSGSHTIDYLDSEIRMYLNGVSFENEGEYAYCYVNGAFTEVSVSTTNFMSDLYISSDDEVFNLITGMTYDDKAEDKFWLLLKEEVENLLCDGSWDYTKADWLDDYIGNGDYWLRTSDLEEHIYYVDNTGMESLDVPYNYHAVRPAFRIN